MKNLIVTFLIALSFTISTSAEEFKTPPAELPESESAASAWVGIAPAAPPVEAFTVSKASVEQPMVGRRGPASTPNAETVPPAPTDDSCAQQLLNDLKVCSAPRVPASAMFKMACSDKTYAKYKMCIGSLKTIEQ